jgi:glycerol-3-phosphate dehydrogenase
MRTSAKAGVEVKIRPGKGVHITFDRRLLNYSLIIEMVDRRMGFLMPHENATILGTTDDDYYGDPDDLRVSEDEVDYLIQGAEYYLPDIRKARMVRAWVGIRPTLFAWGKNEDGLSRDHKVFDHEKTEGIKGIISIAGGKLASYRLMSEEAADLICAKLRVEAKCRTHLVALPGGEKNVSEKELAEIYDVPQYAVHRMIYRHGAKSIDILELTKERPELKETVCRCEPVLAAELVYCIRNEYATTLTDLRNRARLGTGMRQGARCALKAAAFLARELDMSAKEAEESIVSFMEKRWKGNQPIMQGKTLEEEELNQASYFLVGNLNRLLMGK